MKFYDSWEWVGSGQRRSVRRMEVVRMKVEIEGISMVGGGVVGLIEDRVEVKPN